MVYAVYVAVSILLGATFASFVEWLFHKHILHGYGRNKNSVWKTHWHEHHRDARKNNMRDGFYNEPILTQLKSAELRSILLCFFAFVTLSFFVATPFCLTLALYAVLYYVAHAVSHRRPDLAARWLKHHVDHHMGKNQNANWCVLLPLADHILGTREKK